MTAPPPPLSDRLAGFLLGLLAVVLSAVCLAYLAARYVVWPRLDAWRPEIVSQLERQLGRPVSTGALRPGWDGLHPMLEVDRLRIDGEDGQPRLEVASALVGVSWRSLLTGSPRISTLRLEAPTLVVERLGPGRVAVAGFEIVQHTSGSGNALDGLLMSGDFDIDGATVVLVDREGGFAPQRLDGVALKVRNTGRRHQASLSIREAPGASGPISALIAFDRPPLTAPGEWRRWKGDAHLSAQALELARVARLAQAFLPPRMALPSGLSGRIDELAWIRFDQGRVLDATLKLQAAAPAVDLPEGRLALRSIRGEAHLERQRDGGQSLQLTGLSVTDSRGFSLAADGNAELGFDAAGGLRAAWLRLQSFDARSALAALRRLPLPAATAARLQAIDADGSVSGLALRWSRPGGQATELRPADRSADTLRARPELGAFELSATFERLGLRALEPAAEGWFGRPGFANLSGTVRATDRGGRVSLASRRATLSFPGVFAEPTVALDRLDGDVDWSVEPDRGVHRLQVSVPRLAVTNADGAATASGTWRSGGQGPGLVEISGRVARVEAQRVKRYLPLKVAPRAREWVDNALVAGIAENLTFELGGDLFDFPFRDESAGRFRLSASVRDVTLAYAPQWPRVEQARGELQFAGAGMEFKAQSGVIGGLRVTEAVARIPDMKDGQLAVEGRAVGPAQAMLSVVNDSPVAATVSTFTRDLGIGGDARLALRLQVPLNDLAATRVAGSVELAGNDVVIDRTLPELVGAIGRIEFTERGVSVPEIRGTLLGGPLRIEVRPAGEGRMRADASGSIDAAGMRRLVDNPLTRRLDGRTDYRASVEIDRRASTLRLESDLVGLASTLPEPFAKAAAAAWPLRVVSRPLRPGEPAARPPGDRLDVTLRDTIAFVLERERDPATERLLVRRAAFAVDAQPALRESGLSVLLRTGRLDLDAWRAVLSDGELEQIDRSARGGTAPGMSLVPDLVSVVADDLRIAGRDLHDVVFGATRVDGRWRANVVAREVHGQFEWLDARPGERIGTLVARFKRLELPRSREGEVESALSASPSQLPGLDVSAEELVLGNVTVGSLALAATNSGTIARPVWRLDRLVVVNPHARLEAKGSWALGAGGRLPAADADAAGGSPRSTGLDFDLEIRDAGGLLALFGQKDAMRGAAGSMEGTLHWRGSPIALDYGTLDGKVRLGLGKGEFLKVDPGIGKLIGVLNMQSLPRRLSGDFRDLFGEGFVFDRIDGDVRIDRGIARTDDLRMRGVQAQVRIRGEADLQQETQRLQVEVTPELNAGLASLAFGAMVNPIIGLGTFAAQYVLRKPLQDVLAYEIDVTGSWSDPMVSERNRRFAVPPPAVPAQ
jgi:uncharacterized protein (TIGR02099 family)